MGEPADGRGGAFRLKSLAVSIIAFGSFLYSAITGDVNRGVGFAVVFILCVWLTPRD